MSETSDEVIEEKELQDNWMALLAKGEQVPSSASPLEVPDEEWKKRLEPVAFLVLRKHATEGAGSSPLNAENRPGVYVCAGCGLPLFSSAMKFNSGTGWPSFITAVPGAFDITLEQKLPGSRVEYHCARCGGHHGHVFKDGPAPTGTRFCSNGIALRFIPKD
jgi:peptide-methionine (R)-S-oxide reductase